MQSISKRLLGTVSRSAPYQHCTQKCVSKHNCSNTFGTADWVHGDCFWCRYDCMWDTVEVFERNFGNVPQFHGKWPFLAIALPYGFVIQEPASVLFSVLNLMSTYKMVGRFLKMYELPLRKMWIAYGCIGVITWFGSAVFHMSDCDFTEKLDYLGAFTFVVAGLYVSIMFCYPNLHNPSSWKILLGVQIVTGTLWLKHLKDMTTHFDYGYNMLTCIVYSILTSLIFVYFVYIRKKTHGALHEAHIVLIRIVVWANLSAALELLDFAPIFWIFDSHSLFHFATIPIPIWWAEFLDVTYGFDTRPRYKFPMKIA